MLKLGAELTGFATGGSAGGNGGQLVRWRRQNRILSQAVLEQTVTNSGHTTNDARN
jgi:hypothetical protein